MHDAVKLYINKVEVKGERARLSPQGRESKAVWCRACRDIALFGWQHLVGRTLIGQNVTPPPSMTAREQLLSRSLCG